MHSSACLQPPYLGWVWRVEACRPLWVQNQPGLHNKYQGYVLSLPNEQTHKQIGTILENVQSKFNYTAYTFFLAVFECPPPSTEPVDNRIKILAFPTYFSFPHLCITKQLTYRDLERCHQESDKMRGLPPQPLLTAGSITSANQCPVTNRRT